MCRVYQIKKDVIKIIGEPRAHCNILSIAVSPSFPRCLLLTISFGVCANFRPCTRNSKAKKQQQRRKTSRGKLFPEKRRSGAMEVLRRVDERWTLGLLRYSRSLNDPSATSSGDIFFWFFSFMFSFFPRLHCAHLLCVTKPHDSMRFPAPFLAAAVAPATGEFELPRQRESGEDINGRDAI